MTDLSKLRSVSDAYRESARKRFVPASEVARDEIGFIALALITIAFFNLPVILSIGYSVFG